MGFVVDIRKIERRKREEKSARTGFGSEDRRYVRDVSLGGIYGVRSVGREATGVVLEGFGDMDVGVLVWSSGVGCGWRLCRGHWLCMASQTRWRRTTGMLCEYTMREACIITSDTSQPCA